MRFGYVCFWKGQRFEVYALRKIEAQEQAVAYFQKGQRAKVKAYDVSVWLAEKDGKVVLHDGAEL